MGGERKMRGARSWSMVVLCLFYRFVQATDKLLDDDPTIPIVHLYADMKLCRASCC